MPEGQLFGADSTVCREEGLLAGEMAGETVMMSIEKGEYYALDPVAGRIWRLIENFLNLIQIRRSFSRYGQMKDIDAGKL
ncbi:MAG: PqqD family protein [Deltaproteobacteria bacterium]|nr:PqqD family protein [Deltaproteobacteria bacterium]MBF0524971.1 PqqD family protein [Deltaproteobacteria bacterium]